MKPVLLVPTAKAQLIVAQSDHGRQRWQNRLGAARALTTAATVLGLQARRERGVSDGQSVRSWTSY
jgi:hypothetical protein